MTEEERSTLLLELADAVEARFTPFGAKCKEEGCSCADEMTPHAWGRADAVRDVVEMLRKKAGGVK